MKAKQYTKETINALGIRPVSYDKFSIGDTIKVGVRIKEGDKERSQAFEGTVIAIHGNGASSSFMVRKIGANAVAVERVFPFYSPLVESIKLVRKGKVRRAKLFYLRKRVGKAAQVAEQVLTKEQKQTASKKEIAASQE